MTTPLVTQQIEDLVVAANVEETTVDLSLTFDDPSTTGQIARFEFADNIGGGGVTDVLLFDQAGVGAPATVANFLDYVENGDYDNSIIHRSVPGFIIQGGGFTVTDSQVVDIPANDPVVNEFSAERSNLRGTISMAKLGGEPDSATNQWFFNLGDNSGNLDNQNGGFTAFGQVLNEEDLAPIDAIALLPIVNGGGALNTVPVTDNAEPVDTDDLVFLERVTLVSQEELEFSFSNSNPELVDITINDGELLLDYVPGQSGAATITLEATNLLGESVEEEFIVTVEETPEEETPEEETPEEETPEEETPEEETPEEETPEEETPEEETPEEETPEEETPEEEEIPEEETPEEETPEEEIPEVETPEVETPEVETPEADLSDLAGSTVFRFLDPDTGIHFYVDSAEERAELESSQPDFIPEELEYRTVDPLSGNPEAQEVTGLLNQDTGAFLYTLSENELSFIEENLDNYTIEEDQSFFAFAEEQPGTIPIYRFLNTTTNNHFFTPSEGERESIEANLPNYEFEGIAFYAFAASE